MTQTIIIPIRNLKLYRQIKIGNVLFIKSAKAVKKDSPYASQVKEMLTINDEDRKSEWRLHIKESFRNCSLAVYESNQDKDKEAREEAEKNVERSLNVLRFYLSYTIRLDRLDPIFLNMFMAMEGLAYTGLTAALGIRQDGTTHKQSARTGYVRPYEITAEAMRRIKRLHLDKLNKILLKPDARRSPFEKNLLLSIDFYGNGMNENNSRNRFVSFMISLESLLLVEREVRAVLAERAAMILSISSDGRKRIDKRISDLYEIRSKIVHEGKDKITLNDIRALSQIVFEIISKLINYSSKINDKSKLREEVNRLKHSAPPFKI